MQSSLKFRITGPSVTYSTHNNHQCHIGRHQRRECDRFAYASCPRFTVNTKFSGWTRLISPQRHYTYVCSKYERLTNHLGVFNDNYVELLLKYRLCKYLKHTHHIHHDKRYWDDQPPSPNNHTGIPSEYHYHNGEKRHRYLFPVISYSRRHERTTFGKGDCGDCANALLFVVSRLRCELRLAGIHTAPENLLELFRVCRIYL